MLILICVCDIFSWCIDFPCLDWRQCTITKSVFSDCGFASSAPIGTTPPNTPTRAVVRFPCIMVTTNDNFMSFDNYSPYSQINIDKKTRTSHFYIQLNYVPGSPSPKIPHPF